MLQEVFAAKMAGSEVSATDTGDAPVSDEPSGVWMKEGAYARVHKGFNGSHTGHTTLGHGGDQEARPWHRCNIPSTGLA